MLKKVSLSILIIFSFIFAFSCKHNSNNGDGAKSKVITVPKLSPAAGDYVEGFKTITISIDDADLEIFYTTDGLEPTNYSNHYTEPFTIIGSKTVRAVAYYGDKKGPVVSSSYNLNAGKSQSQLGVITGVIGLASNFNKVIKDALAKDTIYIYSDDLPGRVLQSTVGDTFYIDGLDTAKSYSFYFSNKAPGTVIGARAAEVQNDSDGNPIVSVKVSDVTPKEGSGLNLSTVELKPTGTIKGKAKRFSENGSEEADNSGITVFIPGTSFAAYTASDGSFTMTGVPQGLHTIRAMYSGYTYSEQENILLSATSDTTPVADIEEEFSLYYANGTVKGSVFLSDDPIDLSGVDVILTDATNTHSYSAATTTAGTWTVNNVVPGTYSIEFNKTGYVGQVLNDVIVTGAKISSVNQVVLYENGGSISGSVTVSATNNYSGISIIAKSDSKQKSYYALTDINGNFKFDSIAAGTYTVTATYPGYKSEIRTDVIVEIGRDTDIGLFSISEKATYSITGSCVLAGMDSGFEGTNVLLQSTTNQSIKKSTTTNTEGVYTIPDVEVGLYVLTFSRSGFITDSSVSVNVGYTAITVVDTVALQTNAGTVTGNVTLESAEKNEGINILIKSEKDSSLSYTTVTDSKGHYAVAGIAPGTYRVQATKSGYNTGISDPLVVSSGTITSPSDMILSISLRSLYGSVLLEGRQDNTGVRITATKTTKTTEIYSALSNKEGFYALSGMTPGDYILSYSFEGYRSFTSSSVSLSSDSSLNLDEVSLVKATGKISGIVNLEGCTNHSGITVTIVGTDYSYTTEENGAYEFSVPSGNYPGGLRFEKEDFQLTAKAETIPVLTDSTYGVLTVEMKAIANTVKGITTLAGTDDASGITVTVDGLDSTKYKFVTDSTGSWQIDHIPIGYQTIRFSKVNVPDVTCEIDVIPCEFIDIGSLEMIPDSATLKGNVFLDGMSDNANITVTITTKDKDDVVVKTTSDGAFTATNILASGSHTITFSKEGWVSQTLTISDFEPLEERVIGTNREYVLKDTSAPTWGKTPITINSGANFANNTKLHVDLSPEEKGSGIEKMSIQITRTIDGNTGSMYPSTYNWQDYQIGFDFDLKDLPDQYIGNGTYTLYIALKDKSGNISEKANKSITITNLVTSLSGVLTGDKLHLTEECSPYIVEADCLVSEGDTLVIEPGTEVRFAARPNENGEGLRSFSISVSGSIYARGTKDKKILFTANDGHKEITYTNNEWYDYYDDDGNYQWGEREVEITEDKTVYWNGIAINGGSVTTENTYNYVSGNIMEYCEFEYANTPLTIKSDAYINKCNFHDCIGSVRDDSSDSYHRVVFINNSFENGIELSNICTFVNNTVSSNFMTTGMSSYKGISLISTNTFMNMGITFGWNSNAKIQNNVFDNCSIYYESSLDYDTPVFNNNSFIDCQSPIISTRQNYVSGKYYSLSHNYWGSSQTEELNSKGNEANISFISDYYDNFNYARIDYSNWATDPFDNCGYSDTGFITFDYSVNGYDFTSSYYPENTGNTLSIGLNPQYHEYPITQMRIAQSYEELKASPWLTYTENTSFTVNKSKLVNNAATIYVQIKDSKGNISSAVTHSIPYDTPICYLSIEDGTVFGSTTKKQEVRYHATDLGNITSYSLSIDGNRIESNSGNSWGTYAGEWSYQLPLAYMAGGTHTLKMTATDSAGNTGEKSISFTINRNFSESTVKDICYNSTTGQLYKDANTLHLWHLDNDGKEDSGTAEISGYTHTNGGFEGSASYLNGTVPLNINTNSFSIEFWIRGNNSVSINKESVLGVCNYYYNETDYNDYIYHYYTTTESISNNSIGSSSARSRGDDQWHYWAYTYDGTYCAIYCDGVCVSYNDGYTHTLNSNNNDLRIEANCIIDELRISNKARSADEINSYYKTAKAILDTNTGSLEAIVY